MPVINLRNVPDDLKNQFKAVCAEQGKNMTEVLIELMKKEVEKRRKQKEK